MSFDSVPEDKEESYPCDCGGNITKDQNQEGKWCCDSCDWMPPQKETETNEGQFKLWIGILRNLAKQFNDFPLSEDDEDYRDFFDDGLSPEETIHQEANNS